MNACNGFDRVYAGATRVYQDIQKSWVMPTLPKEAPGGRPWGVQRRAKHDQMQLAIGNGLILVAGNQNFSIIYSASKGICTIIGKNRLKYVVEGI